MFELTKIRSDFPILSKKRNEKPFIYFDNAATTQKPKEVINEICDFYTSYNSNVERGMYFLADKSTKKFNNTRSVVRSFLNARFNEEIIFTSGCTQSINMVCFGFLSKLIKPGDEILIGKMEHHANLVPWQVASSTLQAKLIPLESSKNGIIDISDLKKKINRRVKFIAIQHISNITGHENNIQEICSIAHNHNAFVLVDGAQAVSHIPVNVDGLNCDFYCFSGHKCFGPTGVGVLYGKKDLLMRMDPLLFGGNMIKTVSFYKSSLGDLPQKLEAGTPNIAGVIGLGAAINYILSLGVGNIKLAEEVLIKKMWSALKSLDSVSLPITTAPNSPIFSFSVNGVHSYDVGTLLDEMNICVRTGSLCAQPGIKELNNTSFIRASLCFYNTENEIDVFLSALKKVIKLL